ncbi:MAG: M28 family peptidase [Gammaproteobacteria bacterium]|nr:M28 family peptidase [Gammaproteobacteria bacterium]
MKELVKLLSVVLFGTLLLAACEQRSETGTTPSRLEVADRISVDNIRSHVEFLADDLLEGRETGTRGYDIAANYVATQYELMGLEPAGDAGSYLQDVTFRRAIPAGGSASLEINGETRPLDIPGDIVLSGSFYQAEQSTAGDLVFVGNGVSAPEFGYDDYEGVDVEGRIVVMMRYGTAPALPESERAHFSATSVRMEAAANKGASGVIFLYHPEFKERASWDYISGAVTDGDLSWVNLDGSVPDALPELKIVARASYSLADELMATVGGWNAVQEKLDAGEVASQEIPAHLEATGITEWEDFTSPNVAAVLPGSNPDLADEYVLYSGHLDAVGMSNDEEAEDRIRNGAYDNAVGIGIMLEVARVFTTMEEQPERSILFLAVTGEEQGLLGSEYWAANPTVPLDKVSANVNLDMPVLTFPLADVIAYGAEHSEMEAIVREQAATQGLELSDDPWPEQRIFTRSDQYSFVKAGVPAVFLVPGWTSSDPDIDGEAKMREFESEHYHQPSDDLDRAFDRDSARRFAATNFLIGLDIANRNRMVAWFKGDYFGEMYGERFVEGGANSGDGGK